jgi:hypothetical protein
MATEIIQKMLRPRSIALIGASREPKKLGHITLKNLIDRSRARDLSGIFNLYLALRALVTSNGKSFILKMQIDVNGFQI